MKKKATDYLAVHHRAVQQCFACDPTAYTASVAPGVPGMSAGFEDRRYRVETFADRELICRHQLSRLSHARRVPYFVAKAVLADVEEHDEFCSRLLDELVREDEASPQQPGRALERKINLAVALGIHNCTGQSLLEAFSEVDDDLIAATLVIAGPIVQEKEVDIATQMAGVYFKLGAGVLCEPYTGFYELVSCGQTQVAIYEVDVPNPYLR